MAGKFQECGVLFANVVENADYADFLGGFLARLLCEQADDFSSRAAKLPLQRLNSCDGHVEVLFEEMLENIHEFGSRACPRFIRRRHPKIPSKTARER